LNRVWKGIFGIRDLTKIQSRNQENSKYNYWPDPGFDCSPGSGTHQKLGTGWGIRVCVSVRNARNSHDPPARAAKANQPDEC